MTLHPGRLLKVGNDVGRSGITADRHGVASCPYPATTCTVSRPAYAMVDLIQSIPVEVVTEMLGYASVPDVLRFMQVRATAVVWRNELSADPLVGQPQVPRHRSRNPFYSTQNRPIFHRVRI